MDNHHWWWLSGEQIKEHFCLHRDSSLPNTLYPLRLNDNLPVWADKEEGVNLFWNLFEKIVIILFLRFFITICFLLRRNWIQLLSKVWQACKRYFIYFTVSHGRIVDGWWLIGGSWLIQINNQRAIWHSTEFPNQVLGKTLFVFNISRRADWLGLENNTMQEWLMWLIWQNFVCFK